MLLPHLAHGEDLARGGVGARDLRRLRAGVLLGARDEGRSHAVHEAVGGRGGDDLAAQAVVADGAREALLDGRREVARQLRRQVRVLGHVGGEQVRVEPDLAVGEQDRQLRARQSDAALAPLGELLVRRQELERAVQFAGALQQADQVLELRQPRRRLQLEGADRLALQVVVAQYQGRDLVGHARQQAVAVAARRACPRAPAG